MQPSRSVALAVLLYLATLVACIGEMPPPPQLRVTSPERGLIKSTAGSVVVMGTATPGPSGSPVTKVTINGQQAKLMPDGTFAAAVAVPEGATLLETVAYSEDGAKAIDARAAHVGELRPVGGRIDNAVMATLSADAFARISTAASETLKTVDLTSLLPPQSFGDEYANLKLTISQLRIGDVNVALMPVAGGLQLSIELTGLSVGANAAYAGVLVPDGSTSISVTADKITIGGTLVVTPAGNGGFKTTVSSPNVTTTALKLQASGLVGDILDLLNRHLASTIQNVTTRSAELALEPLVNTALGALAGPRQLDVLGKTVGLEVSASAIEFSSLGALASLNLQAKIDGSESSPGYIFTPNGTPSLDMGHGVQIALSDDLLNDMLSQVHALGVLDLGLDEDFGLFDKIDIQATLPPMITANTSTGAVRLVLGDMIATVSNDGNTLVRAAINAQVDVAIERGDKADEIAINVDSVQVFANLLDDPQTGGGIGADEITRAANAGVGLQLKNLDKFLVTVPVPTVAGVTLDSLEMRGDNGYVVASGKIH